MIKIPLYNMVSANPSWLQNWYHYHKNDNNDILHGWPQLAEDAKVFNGRLKWAEHLDAELIFDNEEDYALFLVRWSA